MVENYKNLNLTHPIWTFSDPPSTNKVHKNWMSVIIERELQKNCFICFLVRHCRAFNRYNNNSLCTDFSMNLTDDLNFQTKFSYTVCKRSVFTKFLAKMVLLELSFFIRNINTLAYLEKNPLKHALFTLQHYSSSWQQ